MKILITGGSGFLGQYLNIELSMQYEILTLYNETPRNCKLFNSQQVDICDSKKISELFETFKPNIVIHTAAISSPAKASELPPKLVFETNVKSSETIAELCSKNKSKLIYTSTDLVYAGYRGSHLKEDAKLIPISLYAETKLMGEEKIKSIFDDFIILRTALMFGFGLNGTSCFFQEMYFKLKANKKVRVFTDQFRSPISVLEAARIIKKICELDIKNKIINLGGPERLSRYDLALKLCNIAQLDEKLLEKISMYEIKELPHVVDVSMNIDNLKALGIKIKSTDDAIKEIIAQSYNIYSNS